MAKTAQEIIEENAKTIEEWAVQGMTKKEMAKLLGIGYSTFRDKIGENLALSALFKKIARSKKDKSRQQVENVEKSLYERAKGYDEEQIQFFKVKRKGIDENGNKYECEEVIEKKVIVHIQADIQAAKFFLINRAKANWKDNPYKVENDKENLKLKKKELEKGDW